MSKAPRPGPVSNQGSPRRRPVRGESTPDAGAAELLPSSPATTGQDPSAGFPELH